MRKSNGKDSLLNKVEKFQKNSKNAGITLLALVITIVILLIISTAAITFIVTSDIFTKAKFSTDSYNNSTEKENLELAKLNNEIENLQSNREDIQTSKVPIGTVISIIGNTAPEGYIICDDTTYNITDYPDLAAYFATQFGSNNFFGGDGTTTFKVPDLRGEFLRGTGSNGHANQGNGATVGTHQNSTQIPYFCYFGDSNNLNLHYSNGSNGIVYVDKTITGGTKWRYISSTGSFSSSSQDYQYTIRPTNTSVLYCIKY